MKSNSPYYVTPMGIRWINFYYHPMALILYFWSKNLSKLVWYAVLVVCLVSFYAKVWKFFTRFWAIVWSMSLSALSYIGLCEIWPSNPQYVMFWYWLLYFSNMILNTLHHVICRHLSARYWAYFKMATNFKLQQTMYSKLGYWNKATSKCTTTSNFYTMKNP